VDFLAGRGVKDTEEKLGATLSIMHHMNHHLDVFRDAAVDTRELHPIIVTLSVTLPVLSGVTVLLLIHVHVCHSGQELHAAVMSTSVLRTLMAVTSTVSVKTVKDPIHAAVIVDIS
jgi:hypothetical protein